jgi:predicted transcriptional regulator
MTIPHKLKSTECYSVRLGHRFDDMDNETITKGEASQQTDEYRSAIEPEEKQESRTEFSNFTAEPRTSPNGRFRVFQNFRCGYKWKAPRTIQVGGRRGHVQIIADILHGTRIPATTTQIMTRCNLSSLQLRRYLRLMSLKGLIQKRTSTARVTYKKTRDGDIFLSCYNRMAQLFADGR